MKFRCWFDEYEDEDEGRDVLSSTEIRAVEEFVEDGGPKMRANQFPTFISVRSPDGLYRFAVERVVRIHFEVRIA